MQKITVAEGDGIGPEIMEASLLLLEAAGAQLEIDMVAVGEKVYFAGHPTGIDEKAWDSLAESRVLLKAPITTPQGGGYRSLNVTIRSRLGLYANIRPCVSYHPFIETKHPKMDVVIVRENEEDLYIGLEYQQTADTFSATKLISRAASERICRYAFDYAAMMGRSKVSCFTKDNILKLSDGHFHKSFDQIAKEYASIESEHWIVDIGAALLADQPEKFSVIVLPNLYGDILSDVAAQITGSVGLVGTANIGLGGAMFEAIHGSAPDIAGKDCANPSGLILASVLMLNHIGQQEAATRLHNAWLATIEAGIHTVDIASTVTKERVGTKAFAQAVKSRMGESPRELTPQDYTKNQQVTPECPSFTPKKSVKKCVGADLTIAFDGEVEELATILTGKHLKLTKIFNRGLQVWPKINHHSQLVDQWRCRFEGEAEILKLMQEIELEVIKMERLYTFDGKAGYSNA